MADTIDPGDFEALARRYWGTWGEALRAQGDGMASPTAGYGEVLDAWMRNASGVRPDFDATLEHVNHQGKAWWAQMQQVAAQFAGREHSAGEIAAAWRKALGPEANPFARLFSGMDGAGMLPMDQWQGVVASWQQGARHQAAEWLGLPAFGFTREHQERLQAIGKAQLRMQEALARYQQLMAGAGQEAFARFEAKLAEREEPGRQLASVRALFDLWVDAAEEAYAKIALSPDYRHAYGELVNAQMQLRAGQQALAEQAMTALGLPGRAELDSAHRKIAELERQLRRLQRRGEASERTPAAAGAATATDGPPAKRVARAGSASMAAGKTAAKRPANATGKTAPRSPPKRPAKDAAKAPRKAPAKAPAKAARTSVRRKR